MSLVCANYIYSLIFYRTLKAELDDLVFVTSTTPSPLLIAVAIVDVLLCGRISGSSCQGSSSGSGTLAIESPGSAQV